MTAGPCWALGISETSCFRDRRSRRAWRVESALARSMRWMRLITTSQALPALLQEAFLAYHAGSGPSFGPMPVIPTHPGLWLSTADCRAEGISP